MPHLVLDLRWVRSTTLDGIGRVSLSYTAELLRYDNDSVLSPYRYTLLFTQATLRDFCLQWIKDYDRQRPLRADYRIKTCGYDARSLKNRTRLAAELKALAPDLYLSFYYIFHRMPGLNLAMVHDLTPLRYPQYFKQASPLFRLMLCHKPGLRFLLQQADRLLTVSESTRQDILAVLPSSPRPNSRTRAVQVIPLAAAPPEPIQASAPLSEPYLLQVGRADPHKNQWGLLQAYARLPHPLQSQYMLVFAGPEDPRYTPALKTEIQRLQLTSRVHFTGSLSATGLHRFYQHAHLFIMPSYYEGFGLPILEAMQYGVPCVLAQVASLPEVGGRAAHYIPPEDPQSMAKAITKILTSPTLHQRMAEASRQRAEAFDWKTTCQQFIDYIEGIRL